MKRDRKGYKYIIRIIISVICLCAGVCISFLWLDKKDNGLTVYQQIVNQGYEGSKEQFLASLVGETGKQEKIAFELVKEKGYKQDIVTWLDTLMSVNNVKEASNILSGIGDKVVIKRKKESLYETAQRNGFKGNREEWILVLEKESELYASKEASAYELACINGFEGTLSEWLDTLI